MALTDCFPDYFRLRKSQLKMLQVNALKLRKIKFIVPGGEMVLSNEEGIVISITGLCEGKPFQAS